MPDTDCSAAAGLRALHSLCEYSNITYYLASLYILITFPNWWKLVGVGILLISITSSIHHSNEDALLGVKTWGRLDATLANTGLLGGLIGLVALWRGQMGHQTPEPRLMWCTLAVGVFAILTFILSQIANHKIGGSQDPTEGYFGPILAARSSIEKNADLMSTNGFSNDGCLRYQIDYLSLHASWHMLSGIAMGLWAVTVQPCL